MTSLDIGDGGLGSGQSIIDAESGEYGQTKRNNPACDTDGHRIVLPRRTAETIRPVPGKKWQYVFNSTRM
jgi:hypothetical protein